MTWDWTDLVNDSFKPLIDNRDRYLILWGGRGSSKSDFVAKRLIFQCLSEPYFRFILVRKHYNTIKESSYRTIVDTIEELGLSHLFNLVQTPLQINCINGNRFVAAGCDDPKKIKSIKDPTGAWYEEDIPEESDFITITTSIRTMKVKNLQEIFTINPEVEGNFEDNYFYKSFFKGHPDNYASAIKTEVAGQKVSMPYTIHHSTYHDNQWLPLGFKAFLENLQVTNPYYYEIYTLGHWGNRITGSQAYKGFNSAKHIKSLKYDPENSLHISFDFNVNPYMTLTIWQVTGKEANQIDEIMSRDPDNNTGAICRLFAARYRSHTAGLFIYGDPSGVAEDTRSEKGHNDFKIIMKALEQFHPQRRLHKKAPPVVARINWINSVLAIGDGGIEITIDKNCKNTIADYQNGKEDSDGTKFKEKGRDPITKIGFEKWHHATDANDYFLTKLFNNEFRVYLRGGKQEVPETFSTRGIGRFADYD